MRVIDLPVRRFDDLSVAGPLQGRVGRVLRCQEMNIRVQLVGPFDATRASHGHRVVVARAALGRRQIVPAVALVEMRPLDETVRAAGENVAGRSDQLAGGRVPFLQEDAGESRVAQVGARAGAVVPDHVQEPFASIIVMKERGVEAARIDVNPIRPWSLDRRRRRDVIVGVLEAPLEPLDVGIDKPEPAVGVRQARRPDAAGIGLAAHVEQRGPIERPPHQPPIGEIARMMDLHARIPLERRGRDVIVFADATDRRIGIEARQDRIADHPPRSLVALLR